MNAPVHRQRTVAIAGAGFSGAVIAHQLAHAGWRCEVFDSRSHVGGNCHTRRDAQTGILLHAYGPHIFHTSNEKVWRFVRRFADFMPFTNRVKAIARGKVYSMPVNLLTINQFFGTACTPAQAEGLLHRLGEGEGEPRNFEEQALRFLGRALYEAFFRGYTLKQWGRDPAELPASILKRIPVRFNYDDNYYNSAWQGIPREGYSAIVEKLLDHAAIRLQLQTPFTRDMARGYAHVFYSGPIDAWFGHADGRLAYRTLDFVEERHAGDYQGNAVINYCDAEVPHTRISEHKHFAPWETHDATVIYREHSRDCGPGDVPYYPLRLAQDKGLLAYYVQRARGEDGVTFVGRLGTYRYLDMHVTISEALDVAERFLRARESGEVMPAFCVDPLGG